MSQYAFGSGALWGTLSGAATPTPTRFGALQSASIDFSASVKELYGQYQFPLTVARGTVKVQGKAQFGQIQGRAYNDLFFSGSSAVGQLLVADSEAQSVPGVSTYIITVTNAATFKVDLGVRYAATSLPLTRVSSVAAVGQYSVNTATGVYTFFSADASAAVLISYTYTQTTSGQTITVGNQLLGVAPVFQPVLKQQYTNPAGVSQQVSFSMNAATSTKLSISTKLEDFMVPELDFECFCDASNTLCVISVAEIN